LRGGKYLSQKQSRWGGKAKTYSVSTFVNANIQKNIPFFMASIGQMIFQRGDFVAQVMADASTRHILLGSLRGSINGMPVSICQKMIF